MEEEIIDTVEKVLGLILAFVLIGAAICFLM